MGDPLEISTIRREVMNSFFLFYTIMVTKLKINFSFWLQDCKHKSDRGSYKKSNIVSLFAKTCNSFDLFILAMIFSLKIHFLQDYDFVVGKSEYEDVLQCNNSPSSRTPRGHQFPGAFLIRASGLDKVILFSKVHALEGQRWQVSISMGVGCLCICQLHACSVSLSLNLTQFLFLVIVWCKSMAIRFISVLRDIQ